MLCATTKDGGSVDVSGSFHRHLCGSKNAFHRSKKRDKKTPDQVGCFLYQFGLVEGGLSLEPPLEGGGGGGGGVVAAGG